MAVPAYKALENNYPSERMPCTQTTSAGEPAWENQCAIRLSIALVGAGVSLHRYSEPKCKHGHARGAESLANYLWKRWGRPKIYRDGNMAKSEVSGKQGVVFFKDIAGFRSGRGDHIDLWDGAKTMTGEYFSETQQVWFWNL